MTSQERDNAKALRKAGKFADAAPIFRSLWEEEGDPWDGWGLGNCLRKQELFAEALPVLEAVIEKDPKNDHARGDAGWCIYHLQIKSIERADSRTLEAVLKIKELLEPTRDGAYGAFSAFPRSAERAGKLFNDQKDYATALLVTKSLDPTLLSDEEGSMTDGRTLPSDRENWHLIRTKALDGLEQWEDSLAATSEALDSGIRFHLGQATWVHYRKAKALHRLGQDEAAEAELQRSGGLGKVPAIDAALGTLFADQGKDDEAITQYSRALLGQADLGHGVNSIADLARILRKTGHPDDAAAHDALEVAVRAKRGWPVKVPPGVEVGDEGAALSKVRPMWQKWAEEDQTTMQGTIKAYIQDGVAGFILGEDGKDYFFSSKEVKSKDAPGIGARVEFVVAERFDRKKDRMSLAAIQIKPIPGP